MATIELQQSSLTINGYSVLVEMPENITTEPDALGVGAYLRAVAEEKNDRHVFPVGQIADMRRFVCCHRNHPWWMRTAAGTQGREIPVETQFLLAELPDHQYALFLPILDEPFRGVLEGRDDDQVLLILETGDTTTMGVGASALFVAVGDDPYVLMHDAARSVAGRLQTVRLREEKPLPAFIDSFGWCTWDAFYQQVSHDKVREGLQSFADGGVQPRYLILDDGWQSVLALSNTGGPHRLTSFAANEKFPGDVAPTVAMAKGEFGVQTFIVWHAFQGYWAGVEPEAFPQYRVQPVTEHFSPGIRSYRTDEQNAARTVAGVVAPEDIYRFYQDYHRHLYRQGVDGVKVDNQSSSEASAEGLGGRVRVLRQYHEALEGSIQRYFQGNLINCMSCGTDIIYQLLNSTLLRSSDDFWPKRPETHGLHLYTNAFVGFFAGEFAHPDWDMFQSGHEMGAFHAAARAISGGPVYVSDKPEAHDFALLRKLVLADGSVLRCRDIARPTRDCLFTDPTREDALLKVFNRNLDTGIVGVFNARYHEEEAERRNITGQVRPADVEGLAGESFAVYAHNAQTLTRCTRDKAMSISLPEGGFELYTIVPIDNGIAPIGLTDKFNSAGAITVKGVDAAGHYTLTLRGGGAFLVWCAQAPDKVLVDDQPAAFEYDAATGALTMMLPVGAPHTVNIL